VTRLVSLTFHVSPSRLSLRQHLVVVVESFEMDSRFESDRGENPLNGLESRIDSSRFDARNG
jgi:hypothetical protein